MLSLSAYNAPFYKPYVPFDTSGLKPTMKAVLYPRNTLWKWTWHLTHFISTMSIKLSQGYSETTSYASGLKTITTQ